jgi:two-component system response regulator
MSEVSQEMAVLLVEDTPTDAELFIRIFRQDHAEIEIVWLKDGAEALSYLLDDCSEAKVRNTFKLIILDLNLPKVHGLEVLRQIKQDHRTRHIPVVVLTSSTEDCDVVSSFDLCANSYISKPVGFDGFAIAIAQLASYWLKLNHPPLAKRSSRNANER